MAVSSCRCCHPGRRGFRFNTVIQSRARHVLKTFMRCALCSACCNRTPSCFPDTRTARHRHPFAFFVAQTIKHAGRCDVRQMPSHHPYAATLDLLMSCYPITQPSPRRCVRAGRGDVGDDYGSPRVPGPAERRHTQRRGGGHPAPRVPAVGGRQVQVGGAAGSPGAESSFLSVPQLKPQRAPGRSQHKQGQLACCGAACGGLEV